MACHCNILKNLLRTVDKGRFSSFGVELSANNFTPSKDQRVTNYYTGPVTWWAFVSMVMKFRAPYMVEQFMTS
jgi:hypothetical protein